jgi:hypothetical protein
MKFQFSGGIEKEIDFSPFLVAAKNPITKKYLEKKVLANYSIKYGDIVWND